MNNKSKRCSRCGETKAIHLFNSSISKKDGRDIYCSFCRVAITKKWRLENITDEKRKLECDRSRAYRNKNPKKISDYNLRYKYGISLSDRIEMLRLQQDACAICKLQESVKHKGKIKILAVDHDKKTGKVRDLLCQHCNQALGLLRENFETAINLAKYIQKHKEIV